MTDRRLEATIGNITVKPKHRNAGYSWGIQYPLIHGHCPDLNAWLVWNRHTGAVSFAYSGPPGECRTHLKAKEASMPKGYSFNNFVFDTVA